MPIHIVVCQKSKISWFSGIFQFIWTPGPPQMKKFQKFLNPTIQASQSKFYSMICLIAVLVKSLGLKKSMKELGYPPNFWDRVFWDFLDFPKNFWSLWAHPLYGSRGPHIPHLGALGPHRRGGPTDPKNFLGSPGSPNRLYPKN